jgi:TolB-like protein
MWAAGAEKHHAASSGLALVARCFSVSSHCTLAKVPLPLPDKPSIAVLPFQNMSGDPEQNTLLMASSTTSSPR